METPEKLHGKSWVFASTLKANSDVIKKRTQTLRL